MEADIIKGLVVEYHALINILNELVDEKGGVVRLNYNVEDLGGREDREVEHHMVRILPLIFDISRVPILDLVPPPKEWHT